MVCGDAWESIDGYPHFEEKDGKSLILARTEIGVKLLAVLKERKIINADSYPIDKLALIQPYQENRRIVIGARYLGARVAGIYLNFKGFNMLKNSKYATIRLLLSSFYGTLKRTVLMNIQLKN